MVLEGTIPPYFPEREPKGGGGEVKKLGKRKI